MLAEEVPPANSLQLVPFEITACNVIIGFWSDVVPVSAIIAIIIVLYAVINLVNVKWYGEVRQQSFYLDN